MSLMMWFNNAMSPPDSEAKDPQASNRIGTLKEHSLHADLKRWYAQPGDQLEISVDGYVIDILRADLLVEIQTGNFSKIKRKLQRLLEKHRLRLVFPIAHEKWLVVYPPDEKAAPRRRKSPRRGRIEHLFGELVRFPRLANHANFSLEVLFTQEEEIQVQDGAGSWRRKGRRIVNRNLLAVLSSQVLTSPSDYAALLPADLSDPFTTADLARALKLRRNLAQKMAYCLREMGVIEITSRSRWGYTYHLQACKSR